MCICPECGAVDYKIGIVCCRTKQIICIDCCMMCEDYYKNMTGGHGCRYVGLNWHEEKSPAQSRLDQIQAAIDQKYAQIDYFYQTDRPYIAKRIEAEAARLQYESNIIKAEMESTN